MPLAANGHDRVTLKMLRYFYAVAKCGHFTRAAEQLNISKSPLSAQIKELESVLEVTLFERHTRQVELTQCGRLLLEECVLLFDVMQSSLNKVVQTGRMARNQIRIGLVSSIFWAGFGEVIRQFRQSHPDYEILFSELSPEAQKLAIASKEIDIGLSRFADTFNVHPLLTESVYPESMVLAVSDEHPLRDRKRIALSELASERFAMMSRHNSASTELIINSCLLAGFYPNLSQEVVEPTTLMAVVAASQMVAPVPASYARHRWSHVRFVRLEQAIPADVCALYAAHHPSVVRQFLDAMTLLMAPGTESV